ncbi:DUF2975 domain-containing protein [Gracilibacillus sp. D59]|uniref:DUF2975 domain-containing protein n=1 Tax=Gracilibacillus sp. D59 TaxID=3457434 RepID=UPI003FCC6584
MNRRAFLFLKITVFLIGISVLFLLFFILPRLANETAQRFTEFAYLQYPVLIGLYVSAIRFYFALYQSFRLLIYIENKIAFSDFSVRAIKYIKYCAISIGILYVLGMMFLFSQDALHPGILIMGVIIMTASFVFALFTDVLKVLLQSILEIKTENDLTV